MRRGDCIANGKEHRSSQHQGRFADRLAAEDRVLDILATFPQLDVKRGRHVG